MTDPRSQDREPEETADEEEEIPKCPGCPACECGLMPDEFDSDEELERFVDLHDISQFKNTLHRYVDPIAKKTLWLRRDELPPE